MAKPVGKPIRKISSTSGTHLKPNCELCPGSYIFKLLTDLKPHSQKWNRPLCDNDLIEFVQRTPLGSKLGNDRSNMAVPDLHKILRACNII